MSLSVSSSASTAPTAIAGRAIGSATRVNTRSGEAPSERAASSRLAAWVMNMARVVRYT